MSSPTRRRPHQHSEHLRPNGVLYLSWNHMALLNGLLDRPQSQALSRRDWIRAATPHMRHRRYGLHWRIFNSIWTLPTTLYTAQRVSNRWVHRLSERGHDVLAGKVAVHVVGRGRYAPVVPSGEWR